MSLADALWTALYLALVVPAFWFAFLRRKTTQDETMRKKERWLVDVIHDYIGFVMFAGYMLGVVAWIWSKFFPRFPVGN